MNKIEGKNNPSDISIKVMAIACFSFVIIFLYDINIFEFIFDINNYRLPSSSIRDFLFMILFIILPVLTFYLSVCMHELGHYFVTKYCVKQLDFSYFDYPITFEISGINNNVTKTAYYAFLENNSNDILIQKHIKKISIAGIIFESVFKILLLIACVFVHLNLHTNYAILQKYFVIYELFIALQFIVNVLFFYKTSDYETFKEPSHFKYKYM